MQGKSKEIEVINKKPRRVVFKENTKEDFLGFKKY